MKKIIVFDLDGTVITKGLAEGVPSETVDIIKKAQDAGIIMIAATGRRIEYALPILKELGLTHNCICANGAQIVDPTNSSVVSKIPINPEDIESIYKIVTELNLETVVTDGYKIFDLIKDSHKQEIVAAYVKDAPKAVALDVTNELNEIENIVCHVAHPWNGDHDNCYDVDINHKLATKHHALKTILASLKTDEKHYIIGVGDGGNDMPILEASDYAVAVNNAPDHIKAIADELIEPPEKNGFVEFVNGQIKPLLQRG